jgi:ATP-dependent RNA helicase DDX1
MEERRRALDAFKAGDVRFLICNNCRQATRKQQPHILSLAGTDVGARGIDIKELPYVVNMTLPDESEQYIHRVGRVGRSFL